MNFGADEMLEKDAQETFIIPSTQVKPMNKTAPLQEVVVVPNTTKRAAPASLLFKHAKEATTLNKRAVVQSET